MLPDIELVFSVLEINTEKKAKLRKIKCKTIFEGTNVHFSETKSGVYRPSLRDCYQPALKFRGSGIAVLSVVIAITVYHP